MLTGEETLRDDLDRRRLPSWTSPFHWWGPTWSRPEPRDLGDLVGMDVLDRPTAAALARALRAGASVVVAAEPSRVGKSTLANALCAELPVEAERVFIRGSYETFDFADWSSTVAAGRIANCRALLVNEISPHLPIYVWDGTLRRVLRLVRDGAQLIATMHAATPEDVIYQLSRSPVNATPDEIAALDTIVFLGPPPAGVGDRWRVARIVRLHATAHGIRVEDLAP